MYIYIGQSKKKHFSKIFRLLPSSVKIFLYNLSHAFHNTKL